MTAPALAGRALGSTFVTFAGLFVSLPVKANTGLCDTEKKSKQLICGAVETVESVDASPGAMKRCPYTRGTGILKKNLRPIFFFPTWRRDYYLTYLRAATDTFAGTIHLTLSTGKTVAEGSETPQLLPRTILWSNIGGSKTIFSGLTAGLPTRPLVAGLNAGAPLAIHHSPQYSPPSSAGTHESGSDDLYGGWVPCPIIAPSAAITSDPSPIPAPFRISRRPSYHLHPYSIPDFAAPPNHPAPAMPQYYPAPQPSFPDPILNFAPSFDPMYGEYEYEVPRRASCPNPMYGEYKNEGPRRASCPTTWPHTNHTMYDAPYYDPPALPAAVLRLSNMSIAKILQEPHREHELRGHGSYGQDLTSEEGGKFARGMKNSMAGRTPWPGTSRLRFRSFMLRFRYKLEVRPTIADIRLDDGSPRQVMQFPNSIVITKLASNWRKPTQWKQPVIGRLFEVWVSRSVANALVFFPTQAAPSGVGFHGYLARLLPLETLEIGLRPSNNSIQTVFQIAAQEAGI
ncbi:hypothetical protein DFH06DRAFT_1147028 [Mycena polygramma]|nr:hypothetical protein DFH06DRAFT_1147028 [Mycena polygramma]